MVLSVQMTSFHMPDSNIVSMPKCSMTNSSMPNSSMPNSSMQMLVYQMLVYQMLVYQMLVCQMLVYQMLVCQMLVCQIWRLYKVVYINLHCGQIVRVGLAPLTVQHPVIMIVSGYKVG